MKPLIKIISYLFCCAIIDSCSKDTVAPVPPLTLTPQLPLVQQSLSGQEFLFDSLSWQYYNSGVGSPWWDEIYIRTPDRPDLFVDAPGLHYNTYLKAAVFLKFDTTNDWIEVKPTSFYDQNLPTQYLYIIYSPFLVVNVWPLNHHLIGRKAAIKIKFL
jgi:hypothetical protein